MEGGFCSSVVFAAARGNAELDGVDGFGEFAAQGLDVAGPRLGEGAVGQFDADTFAAAGYAV